MVVKTKSGILVDRKISRFISDLMEWDEGVCSFKLTDIDETFWFDDKGDLQEFLNRQACERFYDSSLRKGYFDYNDNGEKVRYIIKELKYGKILSFECNTI